MEISTETLTRTITILKLNEKEASQLKEIVCWAGVANATNAVDTHKHKICAPFEELLKDVKYRG